MRPRLHHDQYARVTSSIFPTLWQRAALPGQANDVQARLNLDLYRAGVFRTLQALDMSIRNKK